MARRRLSTKRLLGIDRSGGSPAATRSDQPLNPLTIPNGIGFVRLALVPVFLIIALSSSRGHHALAAILFALIAWADYLDGFTARLTGQYSRLGALLDPAVDRSLVISGMVVCWHFRLLPRWALVLVIVRELLMIVMTRYSLRRGVDIEIVWAGRLAVAPVMSAPFFAMLNVHWLALILLYTGLALALTATAMYIRRGISELRELSSSD